jgi:hypothetical protein
MHRIGPSLSEATKQSILFGDIHGLLRFARNDGTTDRQGGGE